MTWHHLSANWDAIVHRLHRRFPNLDRQRFADPPRDSRTLTQHLAEAHDLTLFEARQELEDFLDIEALARQVGDLRSG